MNDNLTFKQRLYFRFFHIDDKLTFKHRLYFRFSHSLRSAFWKSFFRLKRVEAEKNIPKVYLKEENIRNLKTLLNREELIKNMPGKKVVAEIGVDHGDFSQIILDITSPAKLYLIDCWADDRYHIGLKNLVEDKFSNEIDKGVVNINVGLSTDVLVTFPDNHFDWVYLDTNHTYQTTKAELAILKSKVVSGGIIAGHDYTIGNWVSGFRYGVIEAVNEFCVTENWEIIFLTAEADHYRSFAIRKIVA